MVFKVNRTSYRRAFPEHIESSFLHDLRRHLNLATRFPRSFFSVSPSWFCYKQQSSQGIFAYPVEFQSYGTKELTRLQTCTPHVTTRFEHTLWRHSCALSELYVTQRERNVRIKVKHGIFYKLLLALGITYFALNKALRSNRS